MQSNKLIIIGIFLLFLCLTGSPALGEFSQQPFPDGRPLPKTPDGWKSVTNVNSWTYGKPSTGQCRKEVEAFNISLVHSNSGAWKHPFIPVPIGIKKGGFDAHYAQFKNYDVNVFKDGPWTWKVYRVQNTHRCVGTFPVVAIQVVITQSQKKDAWVATLMIKSNNYPFNANDAWFMAYAMDCAAKTYRSLNYSKPRPGEDWEIAKKYPIEREKKNQAKYGAAMGKTRTDYETALKLFVGVLKTFRAEKGGGSEVNAAFFQLPDPRSALAQEYPGKTAFKAAVQPKSPFDKKAQPPAKTPVKTPGKPPVKTPPTTKNPKPAGKPLPLGGRHVGFVPPVGWKVQRSKTSIGGRGNYSILSPDMAIAIIVSDELDIGRISIAKRTENRKKALDAQGVKYKTFKCNFTKQIGYSLRYTLANGKNVREYYLLGIRHHRPVVVVHKDAKAALLDQALEAIKLMTVHP